MLKIKNKNPRGHPIALYKTFSFQIILITNTSTVVSLHTVFDCNGFKQSHTFYWYQSTLFLL